MMQVKNVAADMIRDLHIMTSGKYFIVEPTDSMKMKQVAVMINHATKFLLPFGGKLLSDNNFDDKKYWHVTDEDRKLLHLPFNTCLFVFPVEYAEGEEYAKAKQFEVGYTGVLCMHDDREEIGGIVGIPLVQSEDSEGKYWIPSPVGFVVSKKNREELLAENSEYKDSLPKEEDAVFIKYVPFLKKARENDLSNLVRLHNTRLFADAVLDVLRIMQCSNVISEVIPGTGASKQINDKRISKGKSPLYEYHQLTVDVSGSTKEGSQHYNGSGGKRRQHLRRGHVRRCQSGVRIWVQSCVVGVGAIGHIDKEYNLKATRA